VTSKRRAFAIDFVGASPDGLVRRLHPSTDLSEPDPCVLGTWSGLNNWASTDL